MSASFAPRASFETQIPGVGAFALRLPRLPDEAAPIHGWVTQDYARYWNMGDKSLDEIAAFYAAMAASDHEAVRVGDFQGALAFLIEVYDPTRHELAKHYEVRPGDRGMHLLVAPASQPIAGFTSAVFRTVMEFLFDDPDVARIVVEPDVRNTKIHVLNERFGFVRARDVQLREKAAALSFCTRENFAAAIEMGEAA